MAQRAPHSNALLHGFTNSFRAQQPQLRRVDRPRVPKKTQSLARDVLLTAMVGEEGREFAAVTGKVEVAFRAFRQIVGHLIENPWRNNKASLGFSTQQLSINLQRQTVDGRRSGFTG